jgi:hypothetical protein
MTRPQPAGLSINALMEETTVSIWESQVVVSVSMLFRAFTAARVV